MITGAAARESRPVHEALSVGADSGFTPDGGRKQL